MAQVMIRGLVGMAEPLFVFRGDAGARGPADQHRLRQEVGRGLTGDRVRDDHPPGRKLHPSRGVADLQDAGLGLDEVTGPDWSEELDHIVT